MAGDTDGDGVADEVDNCPAVPNPGQGNSDNDDYGDVWDNCPTEADPDQSDTDDDTVGSACLRVGAALAVAVPPTCPPIVTP